MGASIYYQAVKGKALELYAPQHFLKILRNITGSDGNWELDDYWINHLRGAMSNEEDERTKQGLDELIEAIEKHGSIRIWAEY